MAYGRNKTLLTPPSIDKGKQDKSVAFPPGPTDTVSALRWSPVSNHLAAASWDGNVYVYDATVATKTESIKPIASIRIGAPVLDCDISKDGTLAAGASADKKIHLLDMPTGQAMEIRGHSKPVRSVRFIDVPFANQPMVASGSWDKTIRYWDLRQPNPVTTIDLPERVYAMDASPKFLAAATADKNVHLIDLRRDNYKVWNTVEDPLGLQLTSLSMTADGSRWAVGCIGGRAVVQGSDDKIENFSKLTFRCHREPHPPQPKTPTDVYSVNAVAFSPADKDVLATAGGDGTFAVWNVQRKIRLRAPFKVENDHPITALAFRTDGKALAYAMGYDWARGYLGNKNAGKEGENKIVLHVFGEELK